MRKNITFLTRKSKRWRKDRKSTRLNSSHVAISYAVFCLKKKKEVNIEVSMVDYLSKIRFFVYICFVMIKSKEYIECMVTRKRMVYLSWYTMMSYSLCN